MTQTLPTTPGHVLPVTVATAYQSDPTGLLKSLAGENGEHVLLESADIDSREGLKSLFLVDASLRITCNSQRVTVTALTDSGIQLLSWLAEALHAVAAVRHVSDSELTAEFTLPQDNLDEYSRLKAPANDMPLRILQQQLTPLRKHPFAVFLAGVFAFDYLATFESLPEVPEGANSCPDYQFYLAETLLIVDHQQKKTELVGSLAGGTDIEQRYRKLCARMGELTSMLQMPLSMAASSQESAPLPLATVTDAPSAAAFRSIVEDMKEHIRAGDIFQVVPSRTFTLECANALVSYEQLKINNPSPYMFYLKAKDFELFGASPESALKYTASTGQVELYPIAGTRPRARDTEGRLMPDLDSRIELELRNDVKEQAEHMMLVDLARNDIARISKTGTRYVADLLKTDRYSHVMHLVSRVVGTLRDDLDALHAYRACMNMGTLTGAPKLSAAKLIRGAEKQRRGSYGGAVGYLSHNGDPGHNGDMDTCIVIRSAFVKQGQAVVQAGAGVVYDSDPEAERLETEQKARAVIKSIQQANSGAQGTA